jgi:hypothetical protein
MYAGQRAQHCANGDAVALAYNQVAAEENGATEKQLIAIFGCNRPHLAAHYSKMVSQKKLAKPAMHLLLSSE